MECPKCGLKMEYFEAEPDVGLMSAGWECGECEVFVPADLDDDYPSDGYQ